MWKFYSHDLCFLGFVSLESTHSLILWSAQMRLKLSSWFFSKHLTPGTALADLSEGIFIFPKVSLRSSLRSMGPLSSHRSKWILISVYLYDPRIDKSFIYLRESLPSLRSHRAKGILIYFYDPLIAKLRVIYLYLSGGGDSSWLKIT